MIQPGVIIIDWNKLIMDDKLLAKGEPAGQHKNKKDQERPREVLKSEEQKDSPKVER